MPPRFQYREPVAPRRRPLSCCGLRVNPFTITAPACDAGLQPARYIGRVVEDCPDDRTALGRAERDPVAAFLGPPPVAPEQGGVRTRGVIEWAPIGQISRARPVDAVGQVVDRDVTAAISVVASEVVELPLRARRERDQARRGLVAFSASRSRRMRAAASRISASAGSAGTTRPAAASASVSIEVASRSACVGVGYPSASGSSG